MLFSFNVIRNTSVQVISRLRSHCGLDPQSPTPQDHPSALEFRLKSGIAGLSPAMTPKEKALAEANLWAERFGILSF